GAVVQLPPPKITGLDVDAPTTDENGSVTLSGTFDDLAAADVYSVAIQWGDGTSETLSLGGSNRTFSATHRYLDNNPLATPADTYAIGVTLTSDDDRSATGGTMVLVRNVAPLATIAGPPGAVAGQTVSYSATF